jgi:anti-sigma factor RsiW
MDHDRARKLFTAYHDGELAADEVGELESHLAGCEACSAEWDIYRRTIEEISGLHKFAAPVGITEAVEQKIKRRSRGRFFGEQRSFSTQFAIVSFILILLFMLAYLVMTETTVITVLEEDEPVTDGKTPTAQERDAGAR